MGVLRCSRCATTEEVAGDALAEFIRLTNLGWGLHPEEPWCPLHFSSRAQWAYDRGAADERARLAWWLRAGAAGPAPSTPAMRAMLTDLADVLEDHPDRWADAPPARPVDFR